MRKACGEPLILWLMLEETKPLVSPLVRGPGLGQPRVNTVPGAAGQWWLSPAWLHGATVGSLLGTDCTHVLTGGLSAQHCHPCVPSDASPSSPLTALCLVLGCMIFPDGWDAETIRDMCGEKTGKYSLGDCSVRWAYILAIIGILNALILSFLAFVLGNRQNDLLHEELKTESKGECRATGGLGPHAMALGGDPGWE